jgi:hypothetical protein
MKRILPLAFAPLAALAAVALASRPAEDTRFGGEEDVDFAKELWKSVEGHPRWRLASDVARGRGPHGGFQRTFSTWVPVRGEPRPVLVVDAYGGEGATPERIESGGAAWLSSVAIMVQRESGYDPGRQDWFYAAYRPDGEILEGDGGERLAGRVPACMACHSGAKGDDFLFSNDE